MEIVILIILICLYIHYKPYLDFTSDKIILWYNKGKERVYKILFEVENGN